MGYITLSFTGFSSFRREVGVFYFIVLIFCLVFSITFVKTILTGVDNAQLTVMIGIDNFPGNKSCTKIGTNHQEKDVPTLFQLF